MHRLDFRIKYEYKNERGILLPVTLRHGEVEIDFFAHVDTGASFCIFQRFRAEAIGIAVESGDAVRISTVTGNFLAYGHQISLALLGVEIDATVYFAAETSMPRDVLGRVGCLDRLRVGMVDHDRTLYISHYDDPAGA